MIHDWRRNSAVNTFKDWGSSLEWWGYCTVGKPNRNVIGETSRIENSKDRKIKGDVEDENITYASIVSGK